MKPSQYTFIVVPDHDGKNRQFSISRKGTLILIFSIIGILSSMVIALFLIMKGWKIVMMMLLKKE